MRGFVFSDPFPPNVGAGEMFGDAVSVDWVFALCYFLSDLWGEDMELLTDELRLQLPPIRKIHNPAGEDQCMIYAKFLTGSSKVVFYVAEGEVRNSDYLFWGLLI